MVGLPFQTFARWRLPNFVASHAKTLSSWHEKDDVCSVPWGCTEYSTVPYSWRSLLDEKTHRVQSQASDNGFTLISPTILTLLSRPSRRCKSSPRPSKPCSKHSKPSSNSLSPLNQAANNNKVRVRLPRETALSWPSMFRLKRTLLFAHATLVRKGYRKDNDSEMESSVERER